MEREPAGARLVRARIREGGHQVRPYKKTPASAGCPVGALA